MKKATAYLRNEMIFMHSLSETTAGVWILSEPVLTAAKNNSVSIGKNVYAALNNSRSKVPHPTSWKGIFDPVLTLAGVKTYKAFMINCKCVEIEFDGRQVSFLPMKNLGSSGGFERLNIKSVQVSIDEINQNGNHLISTFELSTFQSKGVRPSKVDNSSG